MQEKVLCKQFDVFTAREIGFIPFLKIRLEFSLQEFVYIYQKIVDRFRRISLFIHYIIVYLLLA